MLRIFSTCLIILTLSTSATALDFFSTQDGNFSNPATWGKSGFPAVAGTDYPGPGDKITIGHHVVFDILSSTDTYGQFTINTGSFSLASGSEVFRTVGNCNLNGSLNLEAATVFRLEGDLNVNNPTHITMVDRTSIFRISNQNTNVNINSNIFIEQGIFSIEAVNGNQVTLNGSATVSASNKAAIYLEGTFGTFNINGYLIINEYAEIITEFTGSLTVTINNDHHLLFKYGSSFFRGVNVQGITFNNKPPTFEIQFDTDVNGWRHLSSPFMPGFSWSNLVDTELEPVVLSGQENLSYWDATVSNAGDIAPGWLPSSSTSDPFESGGRSYVIYKGGPNYPFTNNGLIQIAAFTHFALVFPYTLYNSIDPSTSAPYTEGDQGWNYIGNPYSCWLDLDNFLNTEMVGEYQGAHMWDPSSGNYVAYLANGESLENSHSSTGSALSTTSNQYIRVFQGFWVKVAQSSSTTKNISIKAANRTFNPIALPPSYFKTTNTITKLRLNIYAEADSAWDQILVAVNPNASNGFELNNDGLDRASKTNAPNLFLPVGAEKLCINSKPLVATEILPLSISQGINNNSYFINIEKNQFDPNYSAFLEDKKTGVITDLTQNNYQFTHDLSYTENRFNIHLSPIKIDKNDLQTGDKTWQVWTSNGALHIKANADENPQNAQVGMYDLSGRRVFSQNVQLSINEVVVQIPAIQGIFVLSVDHPEFGNVALKVVQ